MSTLYLLQQLGIDTHHGNKNNFSNVRSQLCFSHHQVGLGPSLVPGPNGPMGPRPNKFSNVRSQLCFSHHQVGLGTSLVPGPNGPMGPRPKCSNGPNGPRPKWTNGPKWVLVRGANGTRRWHQSQTGHIGKFECQIKADSARYACLISQNPPSWHSV